MIRLVEGKLGSGKTYFCVMYILRKFYSWDKQFKEYIEKKDHVLLTNIENLKLPHIDLNKEIARFGLDKVFSEEYFDSIRGVSKSILVIVDESQRKLDRKFYNKEVFDLFTYSRHIGLDLILITQDVDSLVREVKVLPEYSMKAVRRSLNLGNNFTYQKVIEGEIYKRVRIRKDKEVFRLYKSFKFEEGEKPKSVFWRYAMMIICFSILGIVMLKFGFIDQFFSHEKRNLQSAKKTNIEKNKKLNLFEKNIERVPYNKIIEKPAQNNFAVPASVTEHKTELLKTPARDLDQENCKLASHITFEDYDSLTFDCGDFLRIIKNGNTYTKRKRTERGASDYRERAQPLHTQAVDKSIP